MVDHLFCFGTQLHCRLDCSNKVNIKGRKCEVDGCDGKHVGLGLCRSHYQKHRLGETDDPKRQCIIEGCKSFAILKVYVRVISKEQTLILTET